MRVRSGSGMGVGVGVGVAALAFMVAVLVAFETGLSAHRRDEYLQAARIAIAPGRVDLQLDLTPGIAVADAIIAEIDRNRDGVLTADEKQAYVARVLSAIELDLDGQPIHVQGPAASTFPEVEAFRRGEGTIALQLRATLPPLPDGAHQLAYHNTHRRDVSVYLANALMPDSDRVSIRAQQRDVDQRDLTIDYVLHDGDSISDGLNTSAHIWLLGSVAGAVMWAGVLYRRSRH